MRCKKKKKARKRMLLEVGENNHRWEKHFKHLEKV